MATSLIRPMFKGSSLMKVLTTRNVVMKKVSSATERIIIDVDADTGVALMKLNKPAANSLTAEFCNQITGSLDDIQKDSSIKGLIITSSLKSIFSGGLDITEMFNSETDTLRKFWTAVQDLWLKLYLYPLTTIASINGHCPAAGTLIAMSCDYRIMTASRCFIGLNETLLGLVAPYWLAGCLKSTIGQRKAEQALQLGTLFSPEEALKVGLVDAVVEEERLLETAKQEMLKWNKISQKAKHTSKLLLRAPLADGLVARKEADVDNFVKFITSEEVQTSLDKYFQSLKSKK